LFEPIRSLFAWEKEHMVATWSRLSRTGDFTLRYPAVALAATVNRVTAFPIATSVFWISGLRPGGEWPN
jgi:hypothetical protein